jgi:hypothetical protein
MPTNSVCSTFFEKESRLTAAITDVCTLIKRSQVSMMLRTPQMLRISDVVKI